MIRRLAILRGLSAGLAVAVVGVTLGACSTLNAGAKVGAGEGAANGARDPDATASTSVRVQEAGVQEVGVQGAQVQEPKLHDAKLQETKVPDDGADEAAKPGTRDLALAKGHFRARHYGLAEMHFRRAAEASPGDPEAWLGLAASYDELKRTSLADRAYGTALKITGPTPEFLNNRGYSYLLRGDIRRASDDLSAAAAAAPDDERIQNNLTVLDGRARRGR